MNIPESRRKILVRGLKVLCLALCLASAFVLGVLFDRHTEVPNFLEPKPRPKAVVTISASGISVSQSQDFTLYAKAGLKTEGDKVTVSGFAGSVSIFNDSLEVELNFDKSFGTAPTSPQNAPSDAPASSSPSSSTQSALSGRIVASKSGTKYYYESCSEVSRIKKENLVYFKSEADAKANGYEVSSCVQKAR